MRKKIGEKTSVPAFKYHLNYNSKVWQKWSKKVNTDNLFVPLILRYFT